VPLSCVSRNGAIVFVSNKGSDLPGKGPKVGKVVVYGEDEAPIWITCCGLSDG
jgi:hypothetical protein